MSIVIGGWSHGLRAVRPSAIHRHIERQRALAHLHQPPVLPVSVFPPNRVMREGEEGPTCETCGHVRRRCQCCVQVVSAVELPAPVPVEVVSAVESVQPESRLESKPKRRRVKS
jgi:hypothetical protein